MQQYKSVTLTPQDQQQFKSLVNLFDNKKYKKALTAADTILKKNPTHGETLALKGMALLNLDRKKEAIETARLGTKYDVASPVCWNFLGIIYRHERCFNEAIKCFKTALYFDKTNQAVLRDLGYLQAQTRDWAGQLATRKKILDARPTFAQNWVAYAAALHLKGDFAGAAKAIDVVDEMHSGTTNAREAEQYGPYQRSELFMYKISILIESGDNQAALDAMTKHEPIIVDKQGLRELRAEVLLKVGKAAEAESLYRELLKLNPENKNYHIGLQNSLGLYPESGKQLSDDQTQKLVTLYAELQAAYPKAYLVQQFPLLHFLSGDAFSAAFIKYARPQLVKGTPSLFNSIKPLYTQADKVQAIEKALLTALESLKKSKKFAPADAEEADPSVELWVLFFLAQHYNKLQQFNKALEYIEDAIKHSPTLIDLYLIKARIHKHAGNYVDASNLTEKAREMDLADRYLNNKSTLYLLRANRVEEARKTISIFTKVDPETFNNVFDMQVMWYEQEEGESHLRTGNYGAALKKFTNIEAHFREIDDDQYDFHNYCMRKYTLRQYVKLVRLEENLVGQPAYVKAAQGIIETFLAHLDNSPKDAKVEVHSEKPKKGWNNRVDCDSESKKLLARPDILTRCLRYAEQLQSKAANNLRTQTLSFEVYIRNEKYQLALRSLKKAIELAGAEHPEVHAMITKFFHTVSGKELEAATAEEVKTATADILKGATASQYNTKYLESQGKSSLAARLSGAKSQIVLGNAPETTKALVFDLSDSAYPLQALQQSLKFVEKYFAADVESYKTAAHAAYPLVVDFHPKPTEPEAASGANSTTKDN